MIWCSPAGPFIWSAKWSARPSRSNPKSCVGTIAIDQVGTVVGGTGRFAAASGSFSGTLNGRALARRNADGSCSVEQAALVEVGKISEAGSLSF
jgi:hypothetical protein